MKKIAETLLTLAAIAAAQTSETPKPQVSAYKLPLTNKQKKARSKNKQQKASRKKNR